MTRADRRPILVLLCFVCFVCFVPFLFLGLDFVFRAPPPLSVRIELLAAVLPPPGLSTSVEVTDVIGKEILSRLITLGIVSVILFTT